MSNVAHFYHVWADGHWEMPLQEHLVYLRYYGYDAPLYIGNVGRSENREKVREALDGFSYEEITASGGHEYITLNAAHTYAQDHDGVVIYAHTKGATGINEHLMTPWRRIMLDVVIGNWRDTDDVLADYDVFGWAWGDERIGWPTGEAGFLGNFWIARCDYVRTLPRCSPLRRGGNEIWLGLRHPRVLESEKWDRTVGPSVLQSVWSHLLTRWEGWNENLANLSEHLEAGRPT